MLWRRLPRHRKFLIYRNCANRRTEIRRFWSRRAPTTPNHNTSGFTRYRGECGRLSRGSLNRGSASRCSFSRTPEEFGCRRCRIRRRAGPFKATDHSRTATLKPTRLQWRSRLFQTICSPQLVLYAVHLARLAATPFNLHQPMGVSPMPSTLRGTGQTLHHPIVEKYCGETSRGQTKRRAAR